MQNIRQLSLIAGCLNELMDLQKEVESAAGERANARKRARELIDDMSDCE